MDHISPQASQIMTPDILIKATLIIDISLLPTAEKKIERKKKLKKLKKWAK